MVDQNLKLIVEKFLENGGFCKETRRLKSSSWAKRNNLESEYSFICRNEQAYKIILKKSLDIDPICKKCNKNERMFISLAKGYKDFCVFCAREEGYKKSAEYRRSLSDDEIKLQTEKSRITRQEKYGNWNSIENRKKARQNLKITRKNLVNYIGVDNPSKLESVQQKKKDNAIKKYGKYFQQKHLSDDALKLLNDIDYLKSKSTYDIIKETGISQGHLSKILINFGISDGRSGFESSISDFLDSLKIKYEKNVRKKFDMLEMDFVIEDHKLCLEANGIYFHTELFGKDRNYHISKTEKAKEKGYKLIHIWEDDWIEKPDIVKSIIMNKLGKNEKIHARKCILKDIDNKIANKFFEENHLQGSNTRITNSLGLFFNDELVMCVGIGYNRFKKDKNTKELIRFATKKFTNVVGGFSKILKNIKEPLISYCRLDYSDGVGYEKVGWKLERTTKPGYWYADKQKRYNRLKFQKHKIISENSNLTETEIMMKEKNMYKVWDCGQKVYIWNPQITTLSS
jgi:very-short-patch-repair endonuclease